MAVKAIVRFFLIFNAATLAGVNAFAADELPVAPTAEALDDKGVNMLNGGLLVRDPGLGIGMQHDGGLQFARTWAGMSAMVFAGWNHSFNYNVKSDNFLAKVSLGDKSEAFRSSPTGYIPLKQLGSTLSNVNGTFVYTDKDGIVVTLAGILLSSGSITKPVATSLVKPNGERWSFTYGTWSSPNAGTQVYLKSIQTNFGYQLKFSYSPSSSIINSVLAINDAVEYCDPTAAVCSGLANYWPTVNYSRTQMATQANYIETVSGPGNINRSYTIFAASDTVGRPWPRDIVRKVDGPAGTAATDYEYMGISNPQGTTVYYVLKSVSDVSGKWSYSYDVSSSDKFGVTRKSPDQSERLYRSNSPNDLNEITSFTDELSRTTKYLYDYQYNLTDVMPPEVTLSGTTPVAGYIHQQYDSRGNVLSVTKVPKSGSGLNSIVYSAGFDQTCVNPAKCNKPNWVRDPLGNQTDYTYDPSHGGILSEMQSAPLPGAARPLTLTTWVQIYGWAKNSSGAMVRSAYPIWRVATKTVCQTVAGSNNPMCDAASRQTVTTFQYGASATRYALLVKGKAVSSGGPVLRTCYDYDIYGRVMSETAPNAGLGVCP